MGMALWSMPVLVAVVIGTAYSLSLSFFLGRKPRKGRHLFVGCRPVLNRDDVRYAQPLNF